MKKLLLAVFAVLPILSGVALAADMTPAPAYKAPPPVASWTGLYLGAGGGYGLWGADTQVHAAPAGGCPCVSQSADGKGPLGVATAGYDYQFGNKIVGGMFADFNFGSIKGNIEDPQDFTVANTTETTAWAFGARAGWLVTPDILSYFNAGWSEAHFAGGNLISQVTPPGVGAATGFVTPSTNRGGWFLGGGTEMKVYPGWFWRNEYRFAQYSSTSLTETNPATGAGNGDVFSQFHPYTQTIVTELIYKFNWPQ